MNRKEFIRKSFQLGILSSMVAGTVFLLNRNQLDYTCSVDLKCKACLKYEGCELDKAIINREHER